MDTYIVSITNTSNLSYTKIMDTYIISINTIIYILANIKRMNTYNVSIKTIRDSSTIYVLSLIHI